MSVHAEFLGFEFEVNVDVEDDRGGGCSDEGCESLSESD